MLLALIVISGIAWVLRPKSLVVETAAAAARPMRVTVDADALTRVNAHFTVTAPLTGLVQRLTLHEGDLVRAGSAVAVMSTAPAHPEERVAAAARVDAARAGERQAAARLNQASAALAQTERDARRTRELAAGGALPERDVETAALSMASRRADLDAARAQSRMAAAELVQARAALNAASQSSTETTVRAPTSGVVLRVPERSARVVAAGTPLLEIGDPATLEVAADVLSSDAASIRAAQPVELRGWGGAPLRGTVRLVEPSARTRISALGVEEQRLTVVIDLLDAPATLGDGYRLDASIVVWQSGKVLAVPASALLRVGERWSLYVVQGGRATRREVRVGHVGGGLAEITDGLRAGDTVIVFPPDAIRDGVRVKAM
ncbi:MAG TPA: efflux RND transporter periplasmic adaptor subunit [Gemmatimonadaceae bacterium]|nr:efflux RND transporter periplasmic adaptor subunit [Gemmatimonadaceae bacterium]